MICDNCKKETDSFTTFSRFTQDPNKLYTLDEFTLCFLCVIKESKKKLE